MATGRLPINGTAAIQSTIVDAKGDIIAATAADAVSRLAIGANNTVLTADSAEATGLKWAAPGGGGLTFTQLATFTFTGQASNTFSGISGKSILMLRTNGLKYSANNAELLRLRFNADTGTNYFYVNFNSDASTFINPNYAPSGATEIAMGLATASTGSVQTGAVLIMGCDTNPIKILNYWNNATEPFAEVRNRIGSGSYISSSAITSLEVRVFSGTITAGTITLFGA